MCLKIVSSLLILICCTHFGENLSDENVIVTLPAGQIAGHVLSTAENKKYYAFQEVPFAAPPIGKLRFKEPQPPSNWEKVLSTKKNTKICHQIARFGLPSSLKETEDCLYLNIYTPLKPGNDSDTTLPVVVWIYGGGFKNGDGTFQTYGPQFFMDNEVVVVTMNYRVGPFGFLTTDDGVIPGNLALRDQNFAMKWVKRNINLFGGDPEKVTIMGESAGGASVGFHLLSKESEGLFRGAILQSGTAIGSYAHQRFATYYAFQCAKFLNPEFSSNNSTELLEYLQNVPAKSLKNVNLAVTPERENGIGSHSKIVWAPVIENDTLDNAFVTGYLHDRMKNGDFNKVPTLLGFNSEEELLFITYDIMEHSRYYDNNLDLLIHNKFDMSDQNKALAGAELRKIYTNDKFEDVFGSIVRYLSDEAYTTPAARQADLQSSYTDVFLYQFSHKGLMGGINVSVEGVESVTHAEELRYLWSDQSNSDVSKFPVADILTHQRLIKLWTNFIKYLNPTPTKDVLMDNIKWPKVAPGSLRYLNINTALEVQTDPKQYQKFKAIIDKYVNTPLSNY